MKKILAIITTVALSTTLASAELVGSLQLDTNNDTNGVDRLAGFVTRTGNGNTDTRGTVQRKNCSFALTFWMRRNWPVS
ncbi:hypothetical protein [Pontiella sulfatireligans]|uniref:Porin domain-containing protein n=1 Tax=Pontiella sulfatireligans TaxID=2750658 RepID=A0A6C2UDD4_9BACT|nr:hypothetical protein [Pontiella sulfatireligans]VGO18145.1 hypothetical protein SCARR_00196 [Pontiella sulfatireligans]